MSSTAWLQLSPKSLYDHHDLSCPWSSWWSTWIDNLGCDHLPALQPATWIDKSVVVVTKLAATSRFSKVTNHHHYMINQLIFFNYLHLHHLWWCRPSQLQLPGYQKPSSSSSTSPSSSLSSSSKCHFHESKAMSKASHWILQSVAKAVVGAIRTNCKWLCIKKNGGHLFQTIIWICSEKWFGFVTELQKWIKCVENYLECVPTFRRHVISTKRMF